KGILGPINSLGIPILHNLNLNTKHTLTKHNMANSIINKIIDRLTSVDHETINKLHRLGTLSTELTRNNNLNTLSTRLHDKTEYTIAGSTDRQSRQQLVLHGFTLGDGGQTTV